MPRVLSSSRGPGSCLGKDGGMKSVAVEDPAGRQWQVSVRMLPWGLKWRGPRKPKDQPGSNLEVRKGRWFDGIDFLDLSFLDEGFGAFVAILLVIVAIAIAVLFVLPLFIFLIEVLLVAAIV